MRHPSGHGLMHEPDEHGMQMGPSGFGASHGLSDKTVRRVFATANVPKERMQRALDHMKRLETRQASKHSGGIYVAAGKVNVRANTADERLPGGVRGRQGDIHHNTKGKFKDLANYSASRHATSTAIMHQFSEAARVAAARVRGEHRLHVSSYQKPSMSTGTEKTVHKYLKLKPLARKNAKKVPARQPRAKAAKHYNVDF